MILRDILGNIYEFEELQDIESFEENDYILMFNKGQPKFLKVKSTNLSLVDFTIDPPSISFDINTNNLSLSSDTPSSTIYYSLNETNPLDPNTRQQYTNPFNLSQSSTLKAIAIVDGYNSSITEEFIEITEWPILSASNYQTSLGSREGTITYTFNNPSNTTGGTSRKLWYTINVTTEAGSLGDRECSDFVVIGGSVSENFTFQSISVSHPIIELDNTTCTIYTVNDDGSRDKEYYYSSGTTSGNLSCNNVTRPQLEEPIIYDNLNGNIEIEPDLSKWNELPDTIVVEIQDSNGSSLSTTEYKNFPINLNQTSGQRVRAYCVKTNYRNSNAAELIVG